jgi:hypothetical protein
MNRTRPLAFAIIVLASPCDLRPQEPPMSHSRSSFLAARLEASNVVPPSTSPGSGSGVFVFSAKGHQSALSYQLSYATLASPEVRSITLNNFGAGKDGKVVHVICGEEAKKCPTGTDATLRGVWSSEDARLPLTELLWTELANRRIYIEIQTAKGKEIRSQLGANPFMVMAQEGLADLRGTGAAESATGTAAVRLITIRGKPELELLLTVANSRQNPTKVAVLAKERTLGAFQLRHEEGVRPSRTIRMTVTVQDLKALSDQTLNKAFATDELTLIVFLDEGEQNTVRGQVRMVR